MKKQSPSRSVVSALALATVGLCLGSSLAFGAAGASRTYTLDADFDAGVLFNVNHTVPNNNQLQLSTQSSTFPVLWVANAGEDSVSKIDTNTGKEVARYRTWFVYNGANHDPYDGPCPSRTAIDADGNCYVANRHFDGRPAEVMKILASGGIDRNGNGVIDTSSDLDNNGVISPAEMKALVDTNGNSIVDPSELTDERVAWHVRVGPAGGIGRSLTIDPSGFIWLGLFASQTYYKLDPATGAVVAGPISVAPNTPYGAVVDASGILWGASLSNNLLKLNTNTNTFVQVYTDIYNNYGIGFGNGKVYLGYANPVREFNPATGLYRHVGGGSGQGFLAYGVNVASNGDLLVHGSVGGGGATRIRVDGSIAWTSPNQSGANDFQARGCIPDSNGDVWAINFDTNNVQKYNGTTGAPLGVFPVGRRPYTYSNATGSTFVQTIGLGKWTVVFDTTVVGTSNCVINWNANRPGNSTFAVTTAGSNTKTLVSDYNAGDFVAITNGGTSAQVGRYQAIQVTMTADPATSQSPVLFDLKIQAPGTCPTLDLNGDGCISRADLDLELAAIRAGSQDPRYDCNCDGRVDIADSRYLATKFTRAGGAPCPAP